MKLPASLVLYGLLLACLCPPIYGQANASSEGSKEAQILEPPPPRTDAGSTKILETHMQLVGGQAAIDSIYTMRTRYEMNVRGIDILITHTVAKPDKVHVLIETTVVGKPVRTTGASDGTTAWVFDESVKHPAPLEVELGEVSALNEYEFLTPVHDWKASGDVFEYLGKVKSNGREHYLLKRYTPEGKVTYYYFDAKTLMITREGWKEIMKGVVVENDIYYTDFEKIHGMWIPTRFEIMLEDQRLGYVEATSIEVNPEIDPSIFRKPEHKERWLRQE